MARRSCGAEKARQTLPDLISRARRGETTIITRHGRPCAAIVPIGEVQAERRAPSILTLEGSAKGKGYWGADPADWIDRMRDEWK